MSTVIMGSAFLVFWIALCVAVVRFDVEDALWRLIALPIHFLVLTLALPHLFDLGLCYVCWRTEAATKPGLIVCGALFLSVLFVFEITKMIRAAKKLRGQ